jgi:ABC-type branched-subunit amino acid transport system ATPase component
MPDERPPIGEPLLVVDDIDVFYGRVHTLYGVGFEVRANEIVALLGVNGAGKSTLLKAISGIIPCASGHISFAGERIDRLPSHEIVRRGVVQVPGGRGAFPGLTVGENLRLAAAVSRADKGKGAAGDLEHVYDLFPWLRDRRSQLAGTLSGGQQQQLLLARAFLARPRLIMIDELSLGLAPIVVEQLLGIVQDLNRRGVTIVIVEQNVDLALSFSDRAYFLEKGEVRFEGPAPALRERGDLLRSVFLAGATEAAL